MSLDDVSACRSTFADCAKAALPPPPPEVAAVIDCGKTARDCVSAAQSLDDVSACRSAFHDCIGAVQGP
jgi:hypothetical protein